MLNAIYAFAFRSIVDENFIGFIPQFRICLKPHES